MTHPHNPNKKQSKLRKAQARLKGRIVVWEKLSPTIQKGFKKPGSMQM